MRREGSVPNGSCASSGVLGGVAVLMLVACGSDTRSHETESNPAGCVDGCVAVLEGEVRLGDNAGDGILSSIAVHPNRLSDGRYLLHDWNEVGSMQGRLKVYGADGLFLGTIGRSGQGPGEFATPNLAFLSPATGELVVVDQGAARITVLSPDGSTVVATHGISAFASILSVLPLPDGRMILNGRNFVDDGALGQPLHVLDKTGALIRSFGADPLIEGNWDSNAFARRTALSRDGAVWSAMRNVYRIEKWDASGRRIGLVEREVEWFPPTDEVRIYGLSPDQPPTPHLHGLWEDLEGWLWVVFRVPAPDWLDRAVSVELPTGAVRYHGRQTTDDLYHTRIEVLDPASALVIATGEFGRGVYVRDGYAYASILDDDDIPRLHVWRMILKGQTDHFSR